MGADEIHVPTLILLGGSDPLVPAHSVRQMFLAENARRRMLAFNTSVPVIQSGIPTARTLADVGYGGGSPSKRGPLGAYLPRIVFMPKASHGQFWRDAAMMEQVIREVRTTISQGNECWANSHR